MLMRKCKSKSKSALCCMKRVCRDWHYGRVHLTNRRHLLVQNASKWEGKLFCWGVSFSSKCWCAFCRRFVVFVCHDAGSQQGDEDVGMGLCWSWAQGPQFWCCTSSDAELGCSGGVVSQNWELQRRCLQKDWVCFGWDGCP